MARPGGGPRAPFNGRIVLAALLVAAVGCTGDGSNPPLSSDTESVSIATPSSAHEPYEYQNEAQRDAFRAYLECAAEHGVEMEGPFTDSSGTGVYFRQPADAEGSPGRVERTCPQIIVGTFATRVGPVDARLYERTAERFVQCIRSHGFPDFPMPSFEGGDPHDAFGELHFDWSDDRFVSTVKACADVLMSSML